MTDDLDKLCADVREHTRRYMAGTFESAAGFRDLIQLLLGVTVLAPGQSVRLAGRLNRQNSTVALGGMRGPTDPVRLLDGRYLRVSVSLYLDPHEGGGHRLKVSQSSYQYQCDQDGQREVFRYDYLRQSPDEHPLAHLNVHATLNDPSVLGDGKTLARVHFPTRRVSIESVIRLLVRDFDVPTATDKAVWAPVLATAESTFHEIAHQPDR